MDRTPRLRAPDRPAPVTARRPHPARPAPLGFLVLLSIGAGCASAPEARPAAGPRSRVERNVITERQIRDGHFNSAYDAVEAMRFTWLHPRGPDSFVRPTPVWVYVNANRLGGVETLRGIPVGSIVSLRYYDGTTAAERWGAGHGQGVILVSTIPPGKAPAAPFE